MSKSIILLILLAMLMIACGGQPETEAAQDSSQLLEEPEPVQQPEQCAGSLQRHGKRRSRGIGHAVGTQVARFVEVCHARLFVVRKKVVLGRVVGMLVGIFAQVSAFRCTGRIPRRTAVFDRRVAVSENSGLGLWFWLHVFEIAASVRWQRSDRDQFARHSNRHRPRLGRRRAGSRRRRS